MNCKPCRNRWKHWENGGITTIVKTERKGFESLIAHLSQYFEYQRSQVFQHYLMLSCPRFIHISHNHLYRRIDYTRYIV